jgi:alpha-galactosidase
MSGTAAVATRDRAGLLEPTRLAIRVAEANPAARLDAPLPVAAEAPLVPGRTRLGPLDVDVEIRPDGASARVSVRVANASGRALRLESLILGFRWREHGLSSLRFLRHGWQSWSYTGARDLDAAGEPGFPSGPWLRGLHHAVAAVAPDRRGWHESDLVSVAGATPRGPACLIGVLERGQVFGVIYLRRERSAVALEAELRLDAILAPGETRRLEDVYLSLGADASGLLEEYAERLGRSAAARTARPFLAGWCSWYHFFHGVREEDLLRNLDALAAHRQELPVDVVQLDDGYQRAVGDWLETNAKFPRGLAPLAEEIRAAGFLPGIWTAPFCVVPESHVFQKQGDWLLRGDDGEPLCGLLHPQWTPGARVHVLDPSRDEVRAHLEHVFRELAEMGFGYHKLDFLYAVALRAHAHTAQRSPAERLRAGLDAVRAGAGEEAFLLGCGCPLGAAVGIVDAMRIGPDVAPSWRVDPAFAIPGLEQTQPSTRSALRNVLARAWMHRRLWLNDPDCLMARHGATQLGEGERRALAAAIAGTGGLAVFSDDVPTLGPADRALVRETIEIAREVDGLGIPGSARALDLLGGEFAAGVLSASAEGAALTLLNAGDVSARRGFDLASDDLVGAALEPRLGSELPRVTGARLEAALGPRDAALLRLRRAPLLAVFCDFDGTFSVQDVGATLAKRHAGDRRPAVWSRYERGEISAWDYNMEILDGLGLPLSELESFLRSVELDPGARDLVEWCARNGVPFRVLSDGFDFNLNRLQVLHELRFAYDANRLRYERGRWRIAAGHPNPGCGCGTGTCKRGRIEAYRREHPGALLVHIGNGRVSDLCGALAADLAFAKDTLAPELERRGEPFEPFETLHDVIPRLEARLVAAQR